MKHYEAEALKWVKRHECIITTYPDGGVTVVMQNQSGGILGGSGASLAAAVSQIRDVDRCQTYVFWRAQF